MSFPLVRASAERIPFREDRFDLVLSDYGATTFTDPYRTVPESSRVLKNGGTLVFAHASPFRSVALDLRSDRLRRTLVRDYFGLRTLRDTESTEFQLSYSDWIDLFSRSGFVVERLVEPRAPAAWRTSYLSARDQAWGRHWPLESIWKVRKVTPPSAPRRIRLGVA